jgi:hypothetical protein
MHQVLLQPDAFVGVLLPLLDRLSPAGVARLLGLVVTLPEPNAMVLCRRVHEGAPTILSERVAAALDGELPLEPIWLPFAGALLDRDARIERLVALAAAPTTDARVADLAFAALLDAGIATPAVQQLAVTAVGEVGRRRVRDLLAVGADQVPADWLLRRLNEEPARAKLAVQALLRRATFEPELEAWLVELLSQAGPAEGPFLRIAAEVVVQRGSPAVVQQVWPQLARSPHAAGFAASLGRRQQPFTRELLRSELGTQRVGRPELRAAAALALVAQGDDLGSQWLLGHADKLPLPMLQRGATAIVPPAAAALQLLHWAGSGVTPTAARTTPSQAVLAPLPKVSVDAAERAAALVSWAGRCTSEPAVMEALWRLWRDADTDADVRDAALQALAASPARDQLVAEWQQALATSAPAAVAGALPFELLGSMATPASATDLELAASMVLLWPAPATVAVAEVREFDPLVLAVAERLRGEPPAAVAAAFVATATRGLGPTAAAPTRCVELLFALPTVPFRQSVAGALAGWAGAVPPCATATSLPTSPPTWLEPWPAAWFALVAAQQRGDAAAAARCAAMARDALLLTPSQQFLARPLLGERDPAAGVDPLAALAAAPHVAAWQLAIAAGDAAAQQRAANLVREFAGHDAATVAMLATVPPRSEETSR